MGARSRRLSLAPSWVSVVADVIGINSGQASLRRSVAAAQSLAQPAEANGTDAHRRTG